MDHGSGKTKRMPAPGWTVGCANGGLRALVESRGFNLAITTLIVVNAITLGLESSARAVAAA